MEDFEIVLDIFLEDDGVEAFGSLNVNLDLCSILKSFRRDLGIHIALDFSLDTLEHIYSIMGLGTHIFFISTLW